MKLQIFHPNFDKYSCFLKIISTIFHQNILHPNLTTIKGFSSRKLLMLFAKIWVENFELQFGLIIFIVSISAWKLLGLLSLRETGVNPFKTCWNRLQRVPFESFASFRVERLRLAGGPRSQPFQNLQFTQDYPPAQLRKRPTRHYYVPEFRHWKTCFYHLKQSSRKSLD